MPYPDASPDQVAFFREHGWGTWDRLRSSPATASEILFGKLLPSVGLGILQIGVVVAVGFAATAFPASADFKVRSPIVEYRECEFEHNGSVTVDKAKSGLNNSQSYTNSIGCGITPFWKLELEGEHGVAWRIHRWQLM